MGAHQIKSALGLFFLYLKKMVLPLFGILGYAVPVCCGEKNCRKIFNNWISFKHTKNEEMEMYYGTTVWFVGTTGQYC